jgi:hypothetical protein
MAITASDAVTPRYRAQASLDLRKTKPGPDIASVLDARLAAIRLRVAAPPSSVTLFAKPADPTVVVVAEARTARNAEQAADIYAAELLARDVGVDRTATAAAIVRAKAALSRLHGPVRSIRRRLRALEKRQITDADILVAAPADRVAGPEPVTAAIVAALIALVVAAGAAAALEARRPPCAVA